MKLIVFSICINEEDSIKEVLDRIPLNISGIDTIEKIVIDDGSTDKTVEVARKAGAKVFSNGSQKRLAFSFQRAVDIVLSMGADIVVNIDGDLQFDSEQIPELVAPIVNGNADFVASDRFTDAKTGVRRRPENMPVGKYYGNRLGAFVVGVLSGHRFRDVTCGFRAYNKEALMSLNLNSKYTYTQESFQVLAMKRMNIISVPVKVTYFPGRKSRVVTSFVKFLFGSAINILRSFRDHAPLSFFGILGGIPMTLGIVLSLFVFGYWLVSGKFTPYKFVGYVGLYFTTLGIFIWLIGMVADMMDRVLNNQEKILYEQKKKRYAQNI